MKKVLLTGLLLIAFPVMASHIVGGEFELLHISGSRYQLNLVYYFDVINGFRNPNGSQNQPELVDPTLTANIFQKSNNQFVRSVVLRFVSKTRVSYMQPTCSKGEIVTDKLIYTTEIELEPSVFNHPGGYYVSWQRCCRNYSIDNILSPRQPVPAVLTTDPSKYAGQTFYLEFPAVVKNGLPFIDSSPKLFPPLNDFACPGKPYYADFAGQDDDGDSLVYSLVTPLNTTNNRSYPGTAPGPYPQVVWKAGNIVPYSLQNIMNGQPDLRISTDGLLTCTPSQEEGLYVFAVKVEEFRDKIKIGESRRDFQMLVVDKCPVAVPPVIVGKTKEQANFPKPTSNTLYVSFSNQLPDIERYIDAKVSDKDSFKQFDPDFYKENVKIKVVPLNFKRKPTDKWFAEQTAVLTNSADSIKVFRIFFPQCPYFNGEYKIGIIAYDDACSLPLSDTLRVTVNTELPPNQQPQVTPATSIIQLSEGDPLKEMKFIATDGDADPLEVIPIAFGYAPTEFGITTDVNYGIQQNGFREGLLKWDPSCDKYDFTKRTNFIVKVQVNDKDLCNLNAPTFATFNLNILLHAPTIDTDLTTDTDERKVKLERKVFENVNFNITGKDFLSTDLLQLTNKGIGFNTSDLSISMPPVVGNQSVTSNFNWTISCDKIDLKKKDTYTFQFITIGNTNKCRSDTVDVQVKIFPPDNEKPQLFATDPSNVNVATNDLTYLLGQPIDFTIKGIDTDVLARQDQLSLSLIKADGNLPPTGFTFTNVQGGSPISSAFKWNPDCSIFKNGLYENDYTFQFRLADDRCFNAKEDTIQVKITVKDLEGTAKKFDLPNVFTPDSDDTVNDYFLLEGIDSSGNIIDLLPKDNCVDTFKLVQIINRWGNIVFESRDRNFRWYATDTPAGVYYYRLLYSTKEYKSSLSVYY